MIQNNSRMLNKRILFALLAPGIAIYLFVVIIPFFTALWYSFTDWSIGPHKNFIGLQNYYDLIHDDVFWGSLGHNLFIVFPMLLSKWVWHSF